APDQRPCGARSTPAPSRRGRAPIKHAHDRTRFVQFQPGMIIRDAVVDDAAAIAAIQVDASRAAYSEIVPRDYFARLTVERRIPVWRKLITAKNAREQIIVGEDAGCIRAYAHFGRSRDSDASQGSGELQSLYVAPDCWRCGLGAEMLAASIDRLA